MNRNKVPRLRGYRAYIDENGDVQFAPLLDRKPTYRPKPWTLILALAIWTVLIALVTWWVRP